MTDKKSLLVRQLEIVGIGGYETEYRFHPVRRWRLDIAWPEPKVAVEVDGGLYVNGRHSRGKGIEDDMVKLNTATTLGWRVLRVSPRLIREGKALEWVEAMIGEQAEVTNAAST